MAKHKHKGKTAKTTAPKRAAAPARHALAHHQSTALAKREPGGVVEKVKEFSRKVARKVGHRRGETMAKEGGKGHIVGHLVAGLLGGAAGAAAAGLMTKAGLNPLLSSGITTAAGGVGAYMLDGYGRSASVGALGAGGGQLILTAMAKKQQPAQGRKGKRRNDAELPPHEVYAAMEQARRSMGGRNEWQPPAERNAPPYEVPPPPPQN